MSRKLQIKPINVRQNPEASIQDCPQSTSSLAQSSSSQVGSENVALEMLDDTSAASSHQDTQMDNLEPRQSLKNVTGSMYSLMQKVALKKAKTARRFLYEALLYAAFLVIFIVVSWGSRSPWTFWMSDVVSDSIYGKDFYTDRDFSGIMLASDFWKWAEVVLVPMLQPQELTPGLPLTADEAQFMGWYNYLIGVVRLRQLRVKVGDGQDNTVCLISSQFMPNVTKCYREYSSAIEDRSPFSGWNGSNSNVRNAFLWRNEADICNQTVGCSGSRQGAKGTWYPPTGYVHYLSRNATTALQELGDLKKLGWVDYQTRAVIVDFTLYNPGVRMLVSSTAMIEFFPTGALKASYQNLPLKYLGWTAAGDIVVFLGEILLVTSVILYAFYEVYEFLEFWRCKPQHCTICIQKRIVDEGLNHSFPCAECGRTFNQFRFPSCPSCLYEVPDHHLCWKGYFQDPWNAIDLINQGLFLGTFFCRWNAHYSLGLIPSDMGNTFFDFSAIAHTYTMSFWLSSINSVLCFLKLFKYLDKVKPLSVLVRTIFSARGEILYFLLIFVVVFIGYGMAFHLAFGSELVGYRDFFGSILTLFLMMLGNYDFDSLDQSNRVLGPLFSMTFQLIIVLIGMNMFIAIISRAYGRAKMASRNARETFLTSSLKIYFHEIGFKLAGLGLLPQNRALIQIRRLINSFLQSRGFTQSQMDDIRTFKTEVDHNPRNTALFNVILRAFNFDIDREMKPKDFRKLKASVQRWREHEPKLRLQVWENEESDLSDEEEDRCLLTYENSLQVSHPDPSIDTQAVFEKMYRPVSDGGLLRARRKYFKCEKVFSGNEGVDWILRNVYADCPDKQRKDAFALLSFYTRKGFIEHISCEHPYLDEPDVLYHILATNVAEDTRMGEKLKGDMGPSGPDKMRSLVQDTMLSNQGDAMSRGTQSLVGRMKKLDQAAGSMFETISQLDELFDDILYPEQHKLRALKFAVLSLNVLTLDHGNADLHVTVICGRQTEKTIPKQGRAITWAEELLLKVRKVNELIILLECTNRTASTILGTARVLINDALEEELKAEGNVERTILIKDDDVMVGNLTMKMSLLGALGFRQLARLMATKKALQRQPVQPKMG